MIQVEHHASPGLKSQAGQFAHLICDGKCQELCLREARWCVGPVPVGCVMQSKTEMYHANANQCETRAQEVPPALRRDFLVLAENWRKLASKADEAEVKARPKKQTDVN
jgi:hypothetical protein